MIYFYYLFALLFFKEFFQHEIALKKNAEQFKNSKIFLKNKGMKFAF